MGFNPSQGGGGGSGGMPLTGGTFSGNVTMADGVNVVLDTTTGTKIGTATSQKVGFLNATPISRQSDPGVAVFSGMYASDGANIVNALNSIRTTLINFGFIG